MQPEAPKPVRKVSRSPAHFLPQTLSEPIDGEPRDPWLRSISHMCYLHDGPASYMTPTTNEQHMQATNSQPATTTASSTGAIPPKFLMMTYDEANVMEEMGCTAQHEGGSWQVDAPHLVSARAGRCYPLVCVGSKVCQQPYVGATEKTRTCLPQDKVYILRHCEAALVRFAPPECLRRPQG